MSHKPMDQNDEEEEEEEEDDLFFLLGDVIGDDVIGESVVLGGAHGLHGRCQSDSGASDLWGHMQVNCCPNCSHLSSMLADPCSAYNTLCLHQWPHAGLVPTPGVVPQSQLDPPPTLQSLPSAADSSSPAHLLFPTEDFLPQLTADMVESELEMEADCAAEEFPQVSTGVNTGVKGHRGHSSSSSCSHYSFGVGTEEEEHGLGPSSGRNSISVFDACSSPNAHDVIPAPAVDDVTTVLLCNAINKCCLQMDCCNSSHVTSSQVPSSLQVRRLLMQKLQQRSSRRRIHSDPIRRTTNTVPPPSSSPLPGPSFQAPPFSPGSASSACHCQQHSFSSSSQQMCSSSSWGGVSRGRGAHRVGVAAGGGASGAAVALMQKRKERNRMSAAKCRDKQKKRYHNLETEKLSLSRDNEALHREVQTLERERQQLETLILTHSHTCRRRNPPPDHQDTRPPPTGGRGETADLDLGTGTQQECQHDVTTAQHSNLCLMTSQSDTSRDSSDVTPSQ